MSDQNQFDQYKQKLLHYWALFLAGCGTLWEKIKEYARKAADFLGRYAKILWQKLTEFGKAAMAWLRKVCANARPYAKRLVQILASWLLLAREKTQLAIAKAKVWIGSVKERLAKKDALPAPEATRALPAAEENIVEAVAAEPVEMTEAVAAQPVEALPEPEQAPAASEKIPAWKSNPALVKTAAVFGAIWLGIKLVVKWVCKLYKLILAAPVVWYAVKFAMENMERLPEEVGLDIQSTGEFARMISRQEAVYWPLGITMFCLVLMFLSKKPILPWVISIFTLVLPWLIWILNYYA